MRAAHGLASVAMLKSPREWRGNRVFGVLLIKKKNSCGQNTIFLCGNPKTKRHNSSKKIPFFLIDSVWIASSYIGVASLPKQPFRHLSPEIYMFQYMFQRGVKHIVKHIDLRHILKHIDLRGDLYVSLYAGDLYVSLYVSPPSETYRSPGRSICFTVCWGSWGMKGECGVRFLASEKKKTAAIKTLFFFV